jgi:hypothetical protein
MAGEALYHLYKNYTQPSRTTVPLVPQPIQHIHLPRFDPASSNKIPSTGENLENKRASRTASGGPFYSFSFASLLHKLVAIDGGPRAEQSLHHGSERAREKVLHGLGHAGGSHPENCEGDADDPERERHELRLEADR